MMLLENYIVTLYLSEIQISLNTISLLPLKILIKLTFQLLFYLTLFNLWSSLSLVFLWNVGEEGGSKMQVASMVQYSHFQGFLE